MRRVRPHLSFANVCSFLALMIALGTGSAYAANTVFSSDIVDGEVTTPDLAADAVNSARIANGQVQVADIGQGAVATDELANNQVKATDIGDGEVKSAEIANGQVTADELAANSVRADEVADGQVRSQEIANGQVQAEDLAAGVAPGASGARAWGLVDAAGTLQRSRQVTAVTRLADGIYCIDPAPGIDPTTAVMLVGENLANSFTNGGQDDISHAEWTSNPSSCPSGTMEVHTFFGQGTPANPGSEFDLGGFDMIAVDQPFLFAIP